VHAVVLFNPVSGKGRAAAASELAAAHLRDAGYSVETVTTRPDTGAAQVAAEAADRAQLLVVAGGDGSLREAIEGLGDAAARIRIALVPLGNANVVARELGIPLATPAAIAGLTDAGTRALDVGRVTLHTAQGVRPPLLFLGMVGIGWDASIVRRIDRIRRSKLGRRWYGLWADSVYFVAGCLASLRRQPCDLQLFVDESPLPRLFRAVLSCNTRTYGKGWSMTPDASVDDGRLDYQARKRSSFPWLVWHLLAAMVTARSPAAVSDYGSGRQLRVSSGRALPVQVDGDDRGDATTIEVSLRAEPARIVCPSGAAAR
jgi:diacylglycerol kinase family enzyme